MKHGEGPSESFLFCFWGALLLGRGSRATQRVVCPCFLQMVERGCKAKDARLKLSPKRTLENCLFPWQSKKEHNTPEFHVF